MPVHLTSNYSKNFNTAAGKRQVSKDPASGCGPLVFISGLGDSPPFQVASMASSSLQGEDSAVPPQTHRQCCLLLSPCEWQSCTVDPCCSCAMAPGQEHPLPGSAKQLLQIPVSREKQNPISQAKTGSSGTQEGQSRGTDGCLARSSTHDKGEQRGERDWAQLASLGSVERVATLGRRRSCVVGRWAKESQGERRRQCSHWGLGVGLGWRHR